MNYFKISSLLPLFDDVKLKRKLFQKQYYVNCIYFRLLETLKMSSRTGPGVAVMANTIDNFFCKDIF